MYAVVHVWWALGNAPRFSWPGESYFPGGWLPVVIAGSAAVIVLGSGIGATKRWPDWSRWCLAIAAWLAGAALLLYSFMFAVSLLQILTGEFSGVADWNALLARASGVIGGIGTIVVAVSEQRRARHACAACGRTRRSPAGDRAAMAPRWAFAAAYLAVVGCASRLSAEAIEAGWGERWGGTELHWTFVVIVAMLVLAGTLLPLALAHRWGRIWPAWLPLLGGRPVPRWLVLAPALFLGAGLVGYFGVGATSELLIRGSFGEPLWWLIMVVPGYIVWGIGLLIAAASYFMMTKPVCVVHRFS